jgi:hypothetical protein
MAQRKITENIVLYLTGTDTQVFADKVPGEGDKKKTIVLKTGDGKVVKLEDCERPDVSTVDGVQRWLKGFNNLPCAPRSGYDSFVNGEGPTNPRSPTKFSPLSTFRIITVYLQALHMKVAGGGQTGEDATKYLALIGEYNKVAGTSAAEALAKLKEAAVVGKAKELEIDPEDLKAYLADRAAKRLANGGNVVLPTSTVTADEDEGGESEEDADAETLEVDADGDDGDDTSESEPAGAIEEAG